MRIRFEQSDEGPEMAKILVVDDDQGCRKLTVRVLSIHGYSAIAAANGVEALDALRREPVDLVLLDLMMPEMDGLTFMHTMREDPKCADVPVLVLSGIADLDFARKVEASGVQGYLVKSRYSIDDLLVSVRQQLARGTGNGKHHPN